MRRLRCDRDNSAIVGFCEACGLRATVAYPSRAMERRPAARYGDPRDRSPPETKRAPSPRTSQPHFSPARSLPDKILTTRSSLEGERNLATAFLAGVARYASVAEQLSPAGTSQVRVVRFKILAGIRLFEAAISPFTDQNATTLLGAAVFHKDLAHRACREASSSQRADAEDRENIRAPPRPLSPIGTSSIAVW
jgi:hypothetical protein